MTMPFHEDVQANLVSMKIVELEGKVFTDQTGRFSVTSSKGNKYIMVLYDKISNIILAEAMKNRTQEKIVRAQTHLHTILTNRGFKTHVQILDNECPEKLEAFFEKENVDFQLVPPHLHQTSAVKRAIATFKDHFIAGLDITDQAFPMHFWSRLLPQATKTLNFLRPSRLNPKVSAEAILNGSFNYDHTSLGPAGTRVIMHEAPSVRNT